MRHMAWPDLPAVHAIEESSFPTTAWSMETFWSELAGVPDTRCYWVAVERDQVVGYTGLMASPPDSDIQTIAVAVTHRGRGVGDQLMVTVIAEATRRRCRWLMLEVEADNDPARSLYERHGFEALARRTSYYGPGHDALVMRRSLGKPDEVGLRG